MAQGKWMMIGWDDNTREYIAEEPAVAQSTMEQPTCQTRKRLIRNWVMLLMKNY